MDITEQLTHESRIALAAAAEISRLRAEVEALRADAERYRWLLKNSTYTNGVKCLNGQAVGPAYRRWYHDSDILKADTLDAAIDAERAAQGERG